MNVEDIIKNNSINSTTTYEKQHLSYCGKDLTLKYEYNTEYSKVKKYKLSKEELKKYLKKYGY